MIIYSFENSINSDGLRMNKMCFSMALFLVCTTITNMRLWNTVKTSYLWVYLGIFIEILIILLFFLFGWPGIIRNSMSFMLNIFFEVVGTVESLIIIIVTSILADYISTIFWVTRYKKRYFPIGIEIENNVVAKNWYYLNNNFNTVMLKKYKQKKNLNAIVNDCFSNTSEMDPIIEKMLTNKCMKGNDTVINIYTLNMRNSVLRNNYFIFNLDKFMKITRNLNFSGIFILFVYIIASPIIKNEIDKYLY